MRGLIIAAALAASPAAAEVHDLYAEGTTGVVYEDGSGRVMESCTLMTLDENFEHAIGVTVWRDGDIWIGPSFEGESTSRPKQFYIAVDDMTLTIEIDHVEVGDGRTTMMETRMDPERLTAFLTVLELARSVRFEWDGGRVDVFPRTGMQGARDVLETCILSLGDRA